jgi:hypothetical protein
MKVGFNSVFESNKVVPSMKPLLEKAMNVEACSVSLWRSSVIILSTMYALVLMRLIFGIHDFFHINFGSISRCVNMSSIPKFTLVKGSNVMFLCKQKAST